MVFTGFFRQRIAQIFAYSANSGITFSQNETGTPLPISLAF